MSGTSEYLRFGPGSIRGYVHDQPTLIITPSTVLLPTSVTHTLPANFYDDVQPTDRIVLDADHSIHKETITATGDFEIKASTAGKDLNLIGTEDVSVTATNGDVIIGSGDDVRITAVGDVNIGGTSIALSGITTGLVLTQSSAAPTSDLAMATLPLTDAASLTQETHASLTAGPAGAAISITLVKLGKLVLFSGSYGTGTVATPGLCTFPDYVIPIAWRPTAAKTVGIHLRKGVQGTLSTGEANGRAVIGTDGTLTLHAMLQDDATTPTAGLFDNGVWSWGGFTALWVTNEVSSHI